MKRDEALADFSRDHLPALRQAKYLMEAGTDDGKYTPEEAAEGFIEFWNDHAALHFYEEEMVILPVLSRLGPVTNYPMIDQMIDDHAWFRDRVSEIESRLESGAKLDELITEVGKRLDTHANMEEKELFQQLQEDLNEEQLEAIHERSILFREKHRPDDIGPREE